MVDEGKFIGTKWKKGVLKFSRIFLIVKTSIGISVVRILSWPRSFFKLETDGYMISSLIRFWIIGVGTRKSERSNSWER